METILEKLKQEGYSFKTIYDTVWELREMKSFLTNSQWDEVESVLIDPETDVIAEINNLKKY